MSGSNKRCLFHMLLALRDALASGVSLVSFLSGYMPGIQQGSDPLTMIIAMYLSRERER